MALGFVLIVATPSYVHELYDKLSKLPEIVELHPLFGEYDLIAKIEADNFDILGEIVVNKIRSVKGVTFTTTFIVTNF